LLDSQIILRKRNTSRLREKVMDKHGKVQEVIRLAPNGRGDFILHINKQALTFSPVLFPLSGNNETTDNQQVTSSQVQNLQQPHSFETIKINNNNSGKVENDSAAPSHSMVPLRDPLRNLLRNEGIGDEGNRNAEFIPSLTEGQQYLKKLNFETQLQRRLPKKDKDFYATLLFMQVKRCLYQKYTPEYWQQIEPHAKNLLRLHLQRLELPIEQAFKTVSRAIQLVKRYLDIHREAYLYVSVRATRYFLNGLLHLFLRKKDGKKISES